MIVLLLLLLPFLSAIKITWAVAVAFLANLFKNQSLNAVTIYDDFRIDLVFFSDMRIWLIDRVHDDASKRWW